jgi:hypothetical protein
VIVFIYSLPAKSEGLLLMTGVLAAGELPSTRLSNSDNGEVNPLLCELETRVVTGSFELVESAEPASL